MPPTDLNEAKRFRAGVFGRGARDYDRVGTKMFGPLGARLVELAGIDSGDRVLDVATGRGAVLFAAAERVGAEGEVIGIDFAPEMVDLVAEEIAGRRVFNAAVERGDAERLGAFREAEFDCVACAFAIFFLPSPDRALREFRRVLRPGGRVAVSSWMNSDDPRSNWFSELKREFGVSVSLETRSFDRPGELRDAMEAAGFGEIRVTIVPQTVRFDGAQEWWRWLHSVAGRAVVEALDPAARERFREAAFERIRRNYGSGSIELENEAIFALGRKPRPRQLGSGAGV